MIQAIKKFIFALRFKWAVKKADTLKHLTHRKHMVLVVNKRLEVFSRKEIKMLIDNGVFRKGTTIHDIEKKAIYITL